MAALEAFDVVVVPFPFAERAAAKRRPAVVISRGETFNAQAGHAVLAMITSLKTGSASWPQDTAITDLAAAGLPAPSLVRMKLFTLDARLILRKAGRLATADRRSVQHALKSVFG